MNNHIAHAPKEHGADRLSKKPMSMLLLIATTTMIAGCVLNRQEGDIAIPKNIHICIYEMLPKANSCIKENLNKLASTGDVFDKLRSLGFDCADQAQTCMLNYTEKFYSIDYSKFRITKYNISVTIRRDFIIDAELRSYIVSDYS